MLGTLTYNEFEVASALAQSASRMSQRELQCGTGLSLATVNRTVRALAARGLVSDGEITADGTAVLETYRVKRAVFLAAGFGERLMPVTLNTPKPLVRVRGERIIDGLVDACLAAGIEEIHIVRGYLADQFDVLKSKYPMVHFIENPLYNEANNVSSALAARSFLRNAYVFEADLLLRNPDIITPYHYSSDFMAFPVERSDDWCFDVRGGFIEGQSLGGLDCHQMVGISYWDSDDGAKLEHDIVEAYAMSGGKELYWEQVPLKVFPDRYKVRVMECLDGDVVEVDTFGELKALDPAYATEVWRR